jgi:squalene synthase HpnC
MTETGNIGSMAVSHAGAQPGDKSRVETPSGKGSKDENFPVASLLISPALRPHVMRFYAFARAIDDIADNPALPSDEKLTRLDAFRAVVTGKAAVSPGLEKAEELRQSLAETGVSSQHAVDLISAFRQDAVQSRYGDWGALMDYCKLSADPVGRYLLALHGEDYSPIPASDALSSALQVLNHLQDCGDDYREMDRVYLPGDWMQTAGVTVEDLAAESLTPGLRQVLDQALDRCDELLAKAATLPPLVSNISLAAEAAVIVNLARRLSAKLRQGDPLASRVSLSKADFVAATVRGVVGTWFSALVLRRRAAR